MNLPAYLRKIKSFEELSPWLYLKVTSTGDMNEALQPILGAKRPGLSASTFTRLSDWEREFHEWSRRSSQGEEFV